MRNLTNKKLNKNINHKSTKTTMSKNKTTVAKKEKKTNKSGKINTRKKIDVKSINKLFEDVKKKNSALKVGMKAMSNLISDLFKTGDQKVVDKIVKKLAFYGFTLDGNLLSNKLMTVKVKIPMEKKVRKQEAIKSEVDDSVIGNNDDELEVHSDEMKVDVQESPVESIEDDIIAENGDEAEDDELFDEDEEEDEKIDDDLDDDERAQLREDRRIAREYERDCRGEYDSMIGDAMRENGDWD